MKHTLRELHKMYPLAADKFTDWCLSQYKVSVHDFDTAISDHRYIIASLKHSPNEIVL